MTARGTPWTRDDLLLAFNLYCRLPFGQYHQCNPDVISLANLMGRTPGSVAMKLSNFASLDESHRSRGIAGLSNVSRADREAWAEFTGNWEQSVTESDALLHRLTDQANMSLESAPAVPSVAEPVRYSERQTETKATVSIRLGQQFFREMILAGYGQTCCVCGLTIPTLLIAAHIVPWGTRPDLRLDPHNGLCLCSLHHQAFDNGLIGVRSDLQVRISPKVGDYLPNRAVQQFLVQFAGEEITLPTKFVPRMEYFEYHIEYVFMT